MLSLCSIRLIPFRTADLLEEVIDYYYQHPGCQSVIGLKRPDTHPYLCATLHEDRSVDTFLEFDINKYYRRQDYPACYQFTAWAMVVSADHVNDLNAQMMSPKTAGYVVPDTVRIVDIDRDIDFYFAEFLLEKGYI